MITMLLECDECGGLYKQDELYRGLCNECLRDEMFKAILDNPVPKKKRKYDDEKEN